METSAQDEDFEPTAEMMVNDFDDERTLDEEEAMDNDGEQDEICDLERVRNYYLECLRTHITHWIIKMFKLIQNQL